MSELKLPDGVTMKDVKEIHKAVEDGRENPASVKSLMSLVKVVMRILRRKSDIEATYWTWKPYYNRAGKPFTRKDAERVRANVLRVSRKMFEIETGKKEQKDE